MSINIPAAHHLMRQDWDLDPLRRGETNGGSLTHNTKSAGSLPVNAANATASTNNTGSSATGNMAMAHHAFLSSGGIDVSTETKVLYILIQFNAANRIQVSTIDNDGIVVRIGSGTATTTTPSSTYKHFRVGGRDTPFGRQNAGIRSCVIDLNDTSNETGAGSFDNTNVTTYGIGTVRHNISGSSSNWYFRQPHFLFDTEKNASDIPTFTGISSNFGQFVDAVLGTDFSDIISFDWISRNGDTLNINAPMQIGTGSSAITFDDEGKTIISAGSNDPSDPRVRVTNQAFRLYWVPRNNAADTLRMSGTYIWGTAAPWDLNIANAATADISDATFTGMGEFEVGSSVSGNAIFNLASGEEVVTQGANLAGSTFNNGVRVLGSSVTTFTNEVVNGTRTFDTSGTYTIDGGDSGSIVNADGTGNLTINLVNGATATTPNPGTGNGQVDIQNSKTLTIVGIPDGLEVRVRQGSFTVDHEQAVTSNTYTYAYNYTSDQKVTISIGGVGDDFQAYERQRFGLTLGDTDQTIPLEFSLNPSYT